MSNTLEHYIEQAGNAKDDIGTVIRKWIGPVCYGEWGKRLTFPQQKLYQDGVAN